MLTKKVFAKRRRGSKRFIFTMCNSSTVLISTTSASEMSYCKCLNGRKAKPPFVYIFKSVNKWGGHGFFASLFKHWLLLLLAFIPFDKNDNPVTLIITLFLQTYLYL